MKAEYDQGHKDNRGHEALFPTLVTLATMSACAFIVFAQYLIYNNISGAFQAVFGLIGGFLSLAAAVIAAFSVMIAVDTCWSKTGLEELKTECPCSISDSTRALIKTFQAQFEEVLLVFEAEEWARRGYDDIPRYRDRPLKTYFLVLVRKGKNWWLATAVILEKPALKDASGLDFISPLLFYCYYCFRRFHNAAIFSERTWRCLS